MEQGHRRHRRPAQAGPAGRRIGRRRYGRGPGRRLREAFRRLRPAAHVAHVLGRVRRARRDPDHHRRRGRHRGHDWAEMLLRMYLRWAERAQVRDRDHRPARGRRGGHQERHRRHPRPTTPTATCAPSAACTAWCASRPSTRRSARHTSFALVEVLPEVEDDIDVDDIPEDIAIDTFRSQARAARTSTRPTRPCA